MVSLGHLAAVDVGRWAIEMLDFEVVDHRGSLVIAVGVWFTEGMSTFLMSSMSERW